MKEINSVRYVDLKKQKIGTFGAKRSGQRMIRLVRMHHEKRNTDTLSR